MREDAFANFMPEALQGVKSETLVSVEFKAEDDLSIAYAEIEVIYVDGELVNGSIFTRTKGGLYYHAENLREAIQMARELVAHWNAKDWGWSPKEPT